MSTKKISKLVIGIIILLFILLNYYGYIQMIKNAQLFINNATEIFSYTIKIYVSEATGDLPYSFSNHYYNPQKIGEYETKSSVFSDTILTYQSKIVDYETMVHRMKETLLLDTKQLSPEKINSVFDSICQSKNIYAKSSIGIHADFFTRLDTLSRDTLDMNINYKVSLNDKGEYEDLDYTAYMELNLKTYWKLFPSSIVYVSLLIIIGSSFFAVVLIKKKKVELSILATVPHIIMDTDKVNIDGINIQLSNQQAKIMKMFTNNDELRINKEELKKSLWPTQQNPISNMTTAIKRLKENLENSGCGCTINTDSEDEGFYILKRIRK